MSRKKVWPAEWPWPISSILWFRQYKRWVNELDPEDIGRMRRNIQEHGFNKGMQVFNIYISDKQASDFYRTKRSLQDLADGKAPGQSKREYDENFQQRRELEKERERKRELMEDLKQEIKNAELDRVSVEDIQKSIDKIKRFGGKN